MDAAIGAAALVRYLANATGAGNGRRTVDRGPTVDRVIGGVQALVADLDQVLGQLVDAMGRQAGDPTLYDVYVHRGELHADAAVYLDAAYTD